MVIERNVVICQWKIKNKVKQKNNKWRSQLDWMYLSTITHRFYADDKKNIWINKPEKIALFPSFIPNFLSIWCLLVERESLFVSTYFNFHSIR